MILSEPGLLALRLAAQRLSGAPASNAVDATRHLLAVQAQDSRGARLALRVRTAGTKATAVDHALTNERSLLVTWANRGTLHLIAAEDEALLHALTTPQLRRANDRQLLQAGMSDAQVDLGISAVRKALEGTGPMTRHQLREMLERAGVSVEGQKLGHLMFRATLEGLVVRGPLIGREHAFVLVADWLGERPRIDREKALGELARRYLTGHGPASDGDLAKWAQLPLRDVRRALGAISAEIVQHPGGLVDLRGRSPSVPRPPQVRLLGPFDPLLLGWRSREFVLDAPQGVITSNGIFRPAVLLAGRVAGTWSLRAGRVELDLWSGPSQTSAAALEGEGAEVLKYLAETTSLD